MNRHAALRQAAEWALHPDRSATAPVLAGDVQTTLDDPALAEALASSADLGRLSDADVLAMQRARRRQVTGVASVAVLLAVVVGIGGWREVSHSITGPAMAHFETRRGEQRNVQLADGSMVEMNGDTSLDVTLADDQRLVELRRGEAYFDVAHQPQRPFVVHAGGSQTRVLGTAFNIDMTRQAVILEVHRGRVSFGGVGAGKARVEVPAGWRSHYSGGDAATAPTRFDATLQGWHDGWIDTDDMRLDDLVDALNRHGGTVVQSPSAKLGGIALAGRFKLDNAQQLLGAIGTAYGFKVINQADGLKLVAVGGSATELQDK